MEESDRGGLPTLVSWGPEELLRAVDSALGEGRTITYAHCETVRRCLADPAYRGAIEALDDCFVDGVGAQIAELLDSGRWPARTTSDDFVRDLWILAARRGLRVALVGGRGGVASRSSEILERIANVRLVLVSDGLLGPGGRAEMADRIAETHPDLVLLGLGQPLQERLAIEVARRSPAAVVLCVGGMFDWLREGPSRPLWARRCGVEWMLRLAEEPRRLWRRYLLGPPETAARIMAGKCRNFVPGRRARGAPAAALTPRTSRTPTAPARACR